MEHAEYVLRIILALLALISFVALVWQWAVAARFPVHRRGADPSWSPAITLLKPLKGCEPDTEACLRSWLQQDYPGRLQFLFGVAREDDPVCGLVRTLLAQYPNRTGRLVICGQQLGVNAKVSTLIQLEPLIEHEYVVISDADVKAAPDLLASLMTPLREPEVGLVNCLYALANPVTPGMWWEAVAINADFWSQVLQSQSLAPLDYALGAVMAVRRASLEEIGGFRTLADYLADDYQLGHRVQREGYRIVLSPLVAECWSAPMTFRQVWLHQLRWARTIRCSKSLPYAASVVSNPTVWPFAWFLVERNPTALAILLAAWGVRVCLGWDLQRRLCPGRPRAVGMILIKDILQMAVWAVSWLGNEVRWRGVRFRIGRGGRLEQRAG